MLSLLHADRAKTYSLLLIAADRFAVAERAALLNRESQRILYVYVLSFTVLMTVSSPSTNLNQTLNQACV